MRDGLFRRHLYFAVFIFGCSIVFRTPLKQLISFSLTNDYGSHILLIAPTTAFLVYLKRAQILANVEVDVFAALSLFSVGAMAAWVAHLHSRIDGGCLSINILALIVLWMGGFILCYGADAFRTARFPWLFLLLLVPFPHSLIDKVVIILQASSAEVTYWLLKLLHVPVFKDGVVLHIHTLQIEVAKQCSGIRSTLALLISALLVDEFVLHSVWRKSLLVISVIPIVILKNGVRIVTLSLLTIYVSPGFLHGWLHTSGGVVFYFLGIFVLIPIAILLRRGETRVAVLAPPQMPSFFRYARRHEL